VTLINTRDCFVHDLIIKETLIDLGLKRKQVIKKEYFFNPNKVPANYKSVLGIPEDKVLQELQRVGVTTYENFYSQAELK
jgi:uncharacterized SAM-binding protein YcdF (DUF218 family)